MDISKLSMYEACLLHSRAERVLKNIVSNHLNERNITRMEWLVLATLCEAEHQHLGLAMSEVADILDVTLSQLTALTIKMRAAGYMEQTVSSTDKRVKILKATRSGMDVIVAIEMSMRSTMHDWLSGIERPELVSYLTTLRQLGSADKI